VKKWIQEEALVQQTSAAVQLRRNGVKKTESKLPERRIGNSESADEGGALSVDRKKSEAKKGKS